ncbi:CPBP family intramembrane metalloprotease [archaeon]|nr:CPBP family intramembrane metalloprotease [archaeon]
MHNPVLIGILQIIPAIALIGYGLVRQKNFQPYLDILLMTLPATLLYGALIGLLPDHTSEGYWYLYFLVKVALFVLPGLIIIKLRGYKLEDFGLTKNRLKLSLLLGFGFLVITTITSVIVSWDPTATASFELTTLISWSIPLFLDAFNEEFLFRGIFFLFVYKNTKNLVLAFIASMVVALAWHPLTPIRMIPVFVQGSLMCYILYKTKNIGGAWVSHGINRTTGWVVAEILAKL